MFSNKDEKKAGQSPEGDLGTLVERLGALPLSELAHNVITIMATIGPEYGGHLSHTVIFTALANNKVDRGKIELDMDSDYRRLHTLLAEGLLALQNSGLVCMFDTPNTNNCYAPNSPG
jgi:hypothetical protein